MNREAQLATMLTVGFAVALFGWALVHLASAPIYKDDQRPSASRLRRWLLAVIDTLDNSYEALRPSTVAETGKDAQDPSNARLNSSVHYLVDKEGTIYGLMRDFYIARHVVGLDQIAIGISNVGASKSSMTDAQLRTDELLIRFLKERNDDIVWLVAASEADKFRGSGLWEEMDVRYREPDFDPGKKFVDRLRELLQKDELNLKPPP